LDFSQEKSKFGKNISYKNQQILQQSSIVEEQTLWLLWLRLWRVNLFISKFPKKSFFKAAVAVADMVDTAEDMAHLALAFSA
jgi:hypothetical protein